MFYHFLVSHLLGVLVFIPPLPNTAIVLFTIQHGSADSGSLTGCLRSPLSSAGTSICPRLPEPNVCPSQVTSAEMMTRDTSHHKLIPDVISVRRDPPQALSCHHKKEEKELEWPHLLWLAGKQQASPRSSHTKGKASFFLSVLELCRKLHVVSRLGINLSKERKWYSLIIIIEFYKNKPSHYRLQRFVGQTGNLTLVIWNVLFVWQSKELCQTVLHKCLPMDEETNS